MHATYERTVDVGSGGFRAFRVILPDPPAVAVEAAAPARPVRFGDRKRPNWVALAIVAGLHALLLAALIKLDVVPIGKPRPKPLVVTLLKVTPPPPAAPPPEAKAQPDVPVTPRIVAPPPVVRPPAVTAPVLAARETPPPPPVAVAGPTATIAGGAVTVGDLASTMISARPPKYPVESRRRKEQGTVYLLVVLDAAGSVADISVSRSSGFPRLDKAALEAVRRWRWSPTLVDGQPAIARGIVDIPFVLQS